MLMLLYVCCLSKLGDIRHLRRTQVVKSRNQNDLLKLEQGHFYFHERKLGFPNDSISKSDIAVSIMAIKRQKSDPILFVSVICAKVGLRQKIGQTSKFPQWQDYDVKKS